MLLLQFTLEIQVLSLIITANYSDIDKTRFLVHECLKINNFDV